MCTVGNMNTASSLQCAVGLQGQAAVQIGSDTCVREIQARSRARDRQVDVASRHQRPGGIDRAGAYRQFEAVTGRHHGDLVTGVGGVSPAPVGACCSICCRRQARPKVAQRLDGQRTVGSGIGQNEGLFATGLGHRGCGAREDA